MRIMASKHPETHGNKDNQNDPETRTPHRERAYTTSAVPDHRADRRMSRTVDDILKSLFGNTTWQDRNEKDKSRPFCTTFQRIVGVDSTDLYLIKWSIATAAAYFKSFYLSNKWCSNVKSLPNFVAFVITRVRSKSLIKYFLYKTA